MNSKTCSKCGVSKAIDFFPVKKSTCKQCKSTYEKEWKEKNKEKMRLYRKAYRERNPDKVANQQRAWVANNPEKKKASIKKWAEKNPSKARSGQNRRSKKFFSRTSANLGDHYIKIILTARTKLKFCDIPSGLIEAKRLHLQSIRATKQLTNVIKEKLYGS